MVQSRIIANFCDDDYRLLRQGPVPRSLSWHGLSGHPGFYPWKRSPVMSWHEADSDRIKVRVVATTGLWNTTFTIFISMRVEVVDLMTWDAESLGFKTDRTPCGFSFLFFHFHLLTSIVTSIISSGAKWKSYLKCRLFILWCISHNYDSEGCCWKGGECALDSAAYRSWNLWHDKAFYSRTRGPLYSYLFI
jgi:hypothetical protein